MEYGRQPGLLSGMSLETFRRAYGAPASELSREEAASTLFRFFRSRHIVDLRLIVVTILGLLCIYLIGILLLTALADLDAQLVVAMIGPAVGIAGLIVSWAYKAASTRLGIIDLFACEIGTLCRVGTVFDIGTHYVSTFGSSTAPVRDEAAKPDASDNAASTDHIAAQDQYTSQEDYFPIFKSNSKDLQLLEALVVWHITEFYTFMKATRDTQRRLAIIPLPKDTAGHPRTLWHTATLDVVYMIFLGYEAARNAIEYLIEFEPAAAENAIVILITELTCYGLLLEQLKDDRLRYPRLKLRQEQYRRITPELYQRIEEHGSENYWRPASELQLQLRERYERALGETMEQALARRLHTPAAAADRTEPVQPPSVATAR